MNNMDKEISLTLVFSIGLHVHDSFLMRPLSGTLSKTTKWCFFVCHFQLHLISFRNFEVISHGRTPT